MRFRLLLFLLPVLLGACSKPAQPVRLDFIGNTTLTSGSRVVNANDTLSTKAYAVAKDNLLKRLRITVRYEPGPSPVLYPVPISGFNPNNAPGPQEIVYLDSLIKPTAAAQESEYLFENQFSARSTSGAERWQYTAIDAADGSASRAYRLTVRKADSAAVFHNYTTVIRPVPGSPLAASVLHDRARVFLSLRDGLLLPKYAVRNNEASVQANQQLIDLVCVANRAGTTIRLDATAADSLSRKLAPSSWPVANRRRTRLLNTRLTATEFGNARTTGSFASAFAVGTAATRDSLSTGVLARGNVVAFRTANGYYGLLLVSDLVPGTSPRLNCSIKVQK
ncbi:hypothetical protein ACFQT0_07480 [Hymenobacter humi]|uniref:DUF4249 family protein n=1 Tax=Hymenobacter humi TaxID=1411620 RepID=A0ABW2U348_9BACT